MGSAGSRSLTGSCRSLFGEFALPDSFGFTRINLAGMISCFWGGGRAEYYNSERLLFLFCVHSVFLFGSNYSLMTSEALCRLDSLKTAIFVPSTPKG